MFLEFRAADFVGVVVYVEGRSGEVFKEYGATANLKRKCASRLVIVRLEVQSVYGQRILIFKAEDIILTIAQFINKFISTCVAP